jgi:hypothetical protein
MSQLDLIGQDSLFNKVKKKNSFFLPGGFSDENLGLTVLGKTKHLNFILI